MNQKASSVQSTPGLFRNHLSWIGAALSIFGLGTTFFLALIDAWSKRPNPYIGIFAYVVFPAILLLGLLLIPLGMLRERSRRRTLAPSAILPYPRIDFNNPRHRRLIAFALGISLFLIPLSAVGSYRAYELTESVSFCGQACHAVMGPEFTAFKVSPHARVACVECHVGPGATSYFHAKLSGVRRAYAAIRESYHRPIPSPAFNLRPAQETCEQCHWPEKFFGTQLRTFTHYGYDEENTPRQLDLLIKVGGGSPATGLTAGIHWHMNISNEILYVSTDEKHQVIPWVRLKDGKGQVTEYFAKDSTLTADQLANAPRRRMDCMDCHNRSAHTFNPPDRVVNEALLAGKLDATLPYIKQQGVELLSASYASTDEGLKKIGTALDAFYRDKYPALYPAKQNEIRAAVAELQRLFRSNYFPEMKVNWESYPENIGHYYSSGCFRCHDGQHVSSDGKVIRKDCVICHTVLGQQEGKAKLMGGNGTEFKHPVDLGEMTDATCTDCHTGKGISQ